MRKLFTLFVTIISSLIFGICAAGCDNKMPGFGGTIPENSVYTITFDAAGGMFADGSNTTVIELDVNNPTFVLPQAPTRSGYEFVSWSYNGETVAEDFIFEGNVIVRAVWEEIEESNIFDDGKVVYDKGGLTITIYNN